THYAKKACLFLRSWGSNIPAAWVRRAQACLFRRSWGSNIPAAWVRRTPALRKFHFFMLYVKVVFIYKLCSEKHVSLVGAGAPTSQPPGFAGPQLCGNSISFCSTSKLFLSINFAQKSLSLSSELGLQHPGGTIPKNSSFVIISHTHPPHR